MKKRSETEEASEKQRTVRTHKLTEDSSRTKRWKGPNLDKWVSPVRATLETCRGNKY